jgi:Holliday junction DNA helicase RuvA
MIAYLKGTIKYKDESTIILLANNIGYKIAVVADILNNKKISDEIELFIHEHFREDADDLYGFNTIEELNFFEDLISVSGVGPKSAMNILSRYQTEDIKKSIIHGDTSLLTKVSGIGKKTADRIILELKNKISVVGGKGEYQPAMDLDDDAISALMSLGYHKSQAVQALSKIDKNLSLEDKIKQALKNI